MSLSRDIPAINAAVNHPAVRPFVGAPDAGPLDFSESVNLPNNWFLMGEHGGFALELREPTICEVHVFITPGGRGRWASNATKEVVFFAEEQGVKTLVAYVEHGRRDLSLYARRAGMRQNGESILIFNNHYDVYTMEIATCLQQ